MRKCLVEIMEEVPDKTRPGISHEEPVVKEARFHQFGTEARYANEMEKIAVTVAIVEILKDGRVLKVDPEKIQFTDEGV